MNSYSLLIFLHVLGAVGMFAAWGIEAVTLRRLRQAVTTGEARTCAQQFRKQGPLGPVAMLTALGTGIWMMVARWGPQPWMTASLAAVAAIVVIGIVLARRGMSRLDTALVDESERLPAHFAALTGSLVASLQLRIALGVGILGLMTMKPGVSGALAIMGAALVSGLGVAIRSTRRPAPAVIQGGTQT